MKSEEGYFATECVMVLTPQNERIELITGQHIAGKLLKKIPAGKLASMLQTRRIVPADEWNPPEVVPDWRDDPASKLELRPDVVALLVKAGLDTVRSVMEFGAANEGSHQKLPGVGPGEDAEIRAAIQKMAAANKPQE